VINNKQVTWLNVTGSGNETSAHVQINPRMTIMFSAFEGKPLILRLYGKARVLHQADVQWEDYISLVPTTPGSRQIFILDIESTLASIGRIKALYADVNFQNYLQYSINPRLISRISSNPNNVSRIFSSFQTEIVISQ
jgi:hypothetical protein